MDSPNMDQPRYTSIPLQANDSEKLNLPTIDHDSNKTDQDSTLTWSDYGNLIMLYVLCFCQGIPTGLAGATIPATFKIFLPYGTVGMFGLTAIPYCFKIVWAPIIDFCWSGQVGRRMTWILPTQVFSGLTMVFVGMWTQMFFAKIQLERKIHHEALYLVAWMLVCTFGALQSCVVDGWSVELLPRSKVHWVGSVHTLGVISGTFTAYTLFMFLFKDQLKYPEEAAAVLAKFISYWGIFFLGVASLLPLGKQERATTEHFKCKIRDAYATVVSICRIRPVQETIIIHLLARLAFEVNDGATDMKLLDKGVPNSTIALLVLMVMPFDLVSAYSAGFLSRRYAPLRIWQLAYILRLLSAAIAAFVVAIGPYGPPSTSYLVSIYVQRVLSVVSGTIMFTTFLQFHLRIADPIASGTYMTILGTAQNMGGILPRLLIMKMIDLASVSTCRLTGKDDGIVNMSCGTVQERLTCSERGGSCETRSDGYFVIGGGCLLVGIIIFLVYLRPTVRKLEARPSSEWLLSSLR